MSSLREIRELLVDFYMNGVLSDEEFVVLYDENRSKNLDLPYDEYGRFDLDEIYNFLPHFSTLHCSGLKAEGFTDKYFSCKLDIMCVGPLHIS